MVGSLVIPLFIEFYTSPGDADVFSINSIFVHRPKRSLKRSQKPSGPWVLIGILSSRNQQIVHKNSIFGPEPVIFSGGWGALKYPSIHRPKKKLKNLGIRISFFTKLEFLDEKG